MALDPRSIQWDASPTLDTASIKWDDEKPDRTALGKALGVPYDMVMGGIKGASNIGDTILRAGLPYSPAWMLNKATGGSNRRKQIDEFFGDKADTSSLAFNAGKLGTEIAGTAGAGGLIAKGLAGVAPRLASAVASGGFNLGGPAATTIGGKLANAGLRTAGGAISGGAAAGLVDPENAGTGALIGGALPGAAKLAGMAGSGLRSAGEHILGMLTGTGTEAVRTAFRSGKTGALDFLENMRGQSSFDDVVGAAKEGLRNMRSERATQYRSGMVDIKADKSVLDMAPILKTVDELKSSGSFKGKVINEKSSGIVKEIADKVDDWAKSKADEFHTPEGLDALKQAIGDIRDSTQFGTQARRAADSVYNAIKSQITEQAPTYSKVMRDYAEASSTITEIEKALSLGNKAAKDTAVRKLQSLLRNNAQTNYGNRLDLARKLEERGGVELGPALAGQAMNTWMPRGMIGALEGAGAVGAAMLAPKALAVAPLTSPRLVGETMYAMGKLSGKAGNALSGVLPATGQNQLSATVGSPVMRNALIQMYAR